MVISWDAVHWGLVMVILTVSGLIILPVTLFRRDFKPKERKKFLLVALAFTAAALLFSIIPAIGPWDIKAEGLYDHVEYVSVQQRKSPAGYRIVDQTVIFFEDGRSYVLPDIRTVEIKNGNRVQILVNVMRTVMLVTLYLAIACVIAGLLWNAHEHPLAKKGKFWHRVVIPLSWPIGMLWLAHQLLYGLVVAIGLGMFRR